MSGDDADWSELPVDLLGLIMDKLKKNTFFLLDFIRFGAVCLEWRSFSIQNHKQIKLPSNLPLLLIPSPFDDEIQEEEEEPEKKHDDDNQEVEEEEEEDQDQTRHKSTRRSFYSLSDRKINQDFQLPVPYYKRRSCRGSSYGWLITVDDKKQQQPDGTYTYPVRLFNPFRSVNNEIKLPPLTQILELDEQPFESYYLIKAYLSANPSSLSNPADLIVFGVYGAFEFGFCRPGDIAWTDVPLERQFRPIDDLVCYKGRFLAIIQNGSVFELDFDAESIKFVARTPANADNETQKYLVESAGDLLQVHRDVFQEDGEDTCSTIDFRVFKLNDAFAAVANNDDWVEMTDNLDGHMLFLGDNNSISLSAADFPGCMPDCIYFTDDNHDYYDVDPGPTDFGIFDFTDQTFDRFYPKHNNTSSSMPPPIWIQPML